MDVVVDRMALTLAATCSGCLRVRMSCGSRSFRINGCCIGLRWASPIPDLIQSLAARDEATLRILRGLVLDLSPYRPEPGARWPGCEAA